MVGRTGGAETRDMTHPPSSYLSPAALESALDLARLLREASEEIRTLATGGALVGGAGGGGGGGRAGDAAMAMRQWIGPHRDTFERLHDDEQASAVTARARLDDEADAWAAFWAQATNARLQRQYDEAMADHRRAAEHFHRQSQAHDDAIALDPSTGAYLPAPVRPIPPDPPTPVEVPTADANYRPTR